MTIFTIDKDKCRKDGLCAAVCPRGIIDITVNESFPQPAEDAVDQCITCGHCSAVCPHHALSLANLGPVDLPANDYSFLPSAEQLHQLIRGRRSTRVYKDKPVARETIERLISLARYAPTAKNTQLLKWLIIDSEEELSAIKNHTIDWMRDRLERDNPAAVAFGFDKVITAWDEGNDPILRGAPGLAILYAPSIYPFGLIDSTIAMTTFELAASAEQVGTCWAGFFMIAVKEWKPLQEALKLPVGHILTTALMIGYPKYRYSRLPERNAAEISWR